MVAFLDSISWAVQCCSTELFVPFLADGDASGFLIVDDRCGVGRPFCVCSRVRMRDWVYSYVSA